MNTKKTGENQVRTAPRPGFDVSWSGRSWTNVDGPRRQSNE